MSAPRWTPDLLKEHIDDRLRLISHDLEGFPEHYATRQDIDLVRQMVEDIRGDHVHRREVEEIKQQQHEAAGRRSTIVIALSVVMTLLGIVLALAWASQLTSAEISAQIQTEAPWVQDRPIIEQRLSDLERQVARLQAELIQKSAADVAAAARLAIIERLDLFFCRTRVLKGLAPC